MASVKSILNSPPKTLDGPELLHHLIPWESYTDACALDFTDSGRRQKYSYHEIKKCVDSLSSEILDTLSSIEDRSKQPTYQPSTQHIIPLFLPQSPSLYISQLAILESGGAFCPINIDAPKDRIKFIVSDVSASIIITTSDFKDIVSWENGPAVIVVEMFPSIPTRPSRSTPIRRCVTSRDLAYVMYTSGSTGQPKGVMLSHHAVSQSLLAHEKHLPKFKRFLQFAAPSFDVSVFEIFFPLTRGCTLVGCRRSQLLNDLPGMINDLEIDAAELTPTVVGSLLQTRANAPGLKLLLTIGEMLTRPIVDEFGGSSSCNGILYAMYGPTEASIHCTIYPRMEASAQPSNIGVPLDTTCTFIAAPAVSGRQDVTILSRGEVGELILSGPQLAQGYLNRAEQNAAAFISVENMRYYRTGDRARQLENGTIEILGRMNGGQVKLRGQRVELGEIEEAVYKHSGIKTATAIIIGSALIIFALVENNSLQSDQVIDTCRKWLPTFMVPNEIVLLRKFPYLPSGKVDKMQLKEDYQNSLDADQDDELSRTSEVENLVKNTLERIIGPFSSRSRLGAVGLDSLVAIRLSSQLRSAGFNVPTVAILKSETLRDLVDRCENPESMPPRYKWEEPTRSSVEAASAIDFKGSKEDVETIIPCSALQSAMLSETAINSHAYWNSVELEISSIKDVNNVISAVNSLATRNAILRTGFTECENSIGYCQIVWKTLLADQIEVMDKSGLGFERSSVISLLRPFSAQIKQHDSSIRIIIQLHHSLYDAWSLELLLDDLDLLLRQKLPPERLRFADVVAAYSGNASETLWSSRDYWKDHLSQIELRHLPNFHSRNFSFSGLAVARSSTSIPTSDVESASRRLSSSPQSIFQAAYAVVLSSYLGGPDICFGTVFSGRTLPIPGIEGVVGPLIATLPIRIDISTSSSVENLVQELNAINRKHLDHIETPLRDIKAAAGINPREMLFDSLLIWQQTLHGYDHSRDHVFLVDSVDTLEFKLTLEVIPGLGNIELKANFEQAVFPKFQIELLLQQIEQLARVIIEGSCDSVNTIFEHVEERLLSAQNTTPDTTLKTGNLFSCVERIAAEDPHRSAIDFARSINFDMADIESMSYCELNTRSNQIGHHLLSLGVLPDELVCICMEKSLDLYASILATVKSGAGYLPVTANIPEDRLRMILSDADVKIIVALTASQPMPGFWEGETVYIDQLDFANLSTFNLTTKFNSDNLAYSVFTSGSTGKPKGVMVTQGNLLSNLGALENLYPATSKARLLQSCSQAFDVSAFEIFFTWRIGACLCSATKDVLFKDIESAIRAMEVTHLSLTPTVAALIDPKNVPNVKFLVTAGEALTQKVFKAWANGGLYQGYGPSETTNICTVNPIVSPRDGINNIGPPLNNTSAFVVSPGSDAILIPRGGEGEFCFGGAQVFRGYMNPAENEGKIIEHPRYGRLYRSGDFGRLMPDGSLTFTGRKDDQIKIRGQRVELSEINAVLLRCNGIRDCLSVVVNSHDKVSQRLVCFWTSFSVTSRENLCLSPDPVQIEEIYHNLEAALPEYMIPSALVPVTQLPVTEQGKTNNRLLSKLYSDLSVSYLNSVSRNVPAMSDHAWSDVELEIAKAAAQVTKVPIEEIGAETSFFSLGIDSISAISLSRILRQVTMRQVEISDILKHSSVARLARRISLQGQNPLRTVTAGQSYVDFEFDKDFLASTIERFNVNGSEVQHILPCTPLQEGMLSAADSSSGNHYMNHVLFKVYGNAERLEDCWREVVHRHEILRTCFVRTDMPRYAYVQVVLKANKAQIDTVMVDRHNSVASIQTAAQRMLAMNDLQPPWRLYFLQASDSLQLLVTMHHALYDGVAVRILYEEVERLYKGTALLSPVSFVPFLQLMMSMDLHSSDKFWDSKLHRLTPSRFNSEVVKLKSQPDRRSMEAPFSLSWMENSAKKHSTSLLSVCHAAWASILSEHLAQSDVCFGNVVSGRTVAMEGVDRLVAPCFNTIPIRLEHIHRLSYLEAFRTLQALNTDSLAFQLTPLRRIQAKFSQDGGRLFDSIFILQQATAELDSSIWKIEDDVGAMDFPIVCEVIPRPSENKLDIVLHSFPSAISDDKASGLQRAFSKTLEIALRNPRQQLLAASTKNKILEMAEIREEENANLRKKERTVKELTSDEMAIRKIILNYTDVPESKISSESSIFRLGLDSINAVQVASQLRKQGRQVTASDVMENSTIAGLATFFSRADDISREKNDIYDFKAFDKNYRSAICSRHSLDSDDIEAIRPCSAVQQGMIAQSLHSDGREYINNTTFEVEAEAPLTRLKSAWAAVCVGHEMLRTGFAATEDVSQPFVMVTYHKESFPLPWLIDSQGDEDMPFISELLYKPWSLRMFVENGRTFLKLRAHHALYDARSMQLILADVAAAYSSGLCPKRLGVNGLLGTIMQSSQAELEEKQRFWQQEENKIVVNKFPNLSPLWVSGTTNVVEETVSSASIYELEMYCRQNGVTMQVATQAAWARVLAAYLGETSTTFGMTLAGRSLYEDAENVSFPSIVTLPVRCDIIGTNAELLLRTMKSNILLNKHLFTPLTSIQNWAGFPGGKIFDTLFAYQKLPSIEDGTGPPWKVVQEEAFVDYAVSLEVQPINSRGMMLRLTFSVDLIPIEQAKLLLRQYDAILLDTIRNPRSPCDILPNFGSDILSITPPKESFLPGPVTLLHEFVENGASSWPNKTALEFATRLEPGNLQARSWTYGELNKESNRIAQMLAHRDVVSGDLVAICFDKCPEASFAITGILKAGCAYVALDPSAPPERVKFILEDSGAQLVLSAGISGKALKKSSGCEVVLVDQPEILECFSMEPPKLRRNISSQDTCYCLYTSGTTGVPKGCLITHENAVQALYSFQRIFAGHWTKDSKWLQFASFHFDVSVLEQFWSWSVGICVASAPRDLIFEDIAEAIRQLNITHIDLTPSLARLIHPDDVPSLCKGIFITGGEQLKQEILDVWGARACIYNGYGPTEATIGCTMYPRVPSTGKPSNIGSSFDNVGSFVLKPGTEIPVLRGGVGELAVSGKLVGKGYLNRPNLTNERFPTLREFDERVYLTGDLVRILHNGNFIFLGRADDQIKLRGQRLELSEISEVIKKSVATQLEVVTLVLKQSTQQKEQLVTFFVVSDPTESKVAELLAQMAEACKARLPGYMVPTHFIPIKVLPLNANNKADKKQLAAMYEEMSVEDLQKLKHKNKAKEAWTDSESKVLYVISESLRIENTGLTRGSTIFELGLDSISIIGFVRRLQDLGFNHVTISMVRSNATLGKLVKAVMQSDSNSHQYHQAYILAKQNITAFAQRHIANICEELSVETTDIECISPCTPMQEGMIYRFLESEQSLYFNQFDFILAQDVAADKLLRAWENVVARLQVLRTSFVETSDGYAQVVLKQEQRSWTDTAQSYDTMDKSLALRFPFALSLVSSASPSFVKLQIFHGLYDGNSMEMMLRRVIEEYNGFAQISYGPNFHYSLPYGPLAKLAGAPEFWTNHLREWVPKELQKKREVEQSVLARMSLQGLESLESVRKRLGVTPQALVQAAWILAAQKFISANGTIGIVTSGRSIDFPSADQVIGPLFNTVPFHFVLGGETNTAAFVSQCHDFNVNMQEFQHTALKEITKWSPAKHGQQLFETLFVFNRPEIDSEDAACKIWKVRDTEHTADYPLAFEATLSPDNTALDLLIVAQASYMTSKDVTNLLEEFKERLQNILENDSTSIILKDVDVSDGTARTTSHEPQALVNGESHPPAGSEPFVWTAKASYLRKEISLLANISEDSVRHSSSIFELGLDSIDVIKLSSRLKKYDVKISVSKIIKCQTISHMASAIDQNDRLGGKPSSIISIDNMSRDLARYVKQKGYSIQDTEAILPATPLQQSMINEMLSSNYKRYWSIEAFELHDRVDSSRLVSAIQCVIRQSPILRTKFLDIEDPHIPVSFAQVIDKEYSLDSSFVLGGDCGFETLVNQFRADSVALAAVKNVLFQVRLIRSNHSRYMFTAISHALYDGKSIRALHEDINRAYNGQLSPRLDFRTVLEDVFQSTTADAKRFWKSTLANLPPALFPRKIIPQGGDSTTVHFLQQKSRISLEDIESFCKASNITLQTLGQTCWAFVLAYLMKQLDVVFGVVLSCRDSEEASEVMFPLMNTVAVRSVLHGSLREMLRYMQDMSDTTRQYQHFPLGTAQAYAMAARSTNTSTDATLFETLFINQGRRYVQQNEPLYHSVYNASEVEFPICVEMEIVESPSRSLSWTTACKSIVRTAEEAWQVLELLDDVLERVLKDADAPTMLTNIDGVSICGLPAFNEQATQLQSILPSALVSKNTEWSDTEINLRRALHEVSGVEEVSITKNTTIFHLGLDSILVLKLPALLKASGVRISVSNILRLKTIAAMAEFLQHVKPQQEEVLDFEKIISDDLANLAYTEDTTALEDELGHIEYIMPVTAGQLFMIRHWQISRGLLFYPDFTYTSKGALDKSKLERAWGSLLQRHDILRTGFLEIGDKVIQLVYHNPLNKVDYSAQRPRASHDLRRPPLSLHVEEFSGSSILTLTIHHALYDGVSLPLILDEFQALYRGQDLPTFNLSFQRFVAQSISASRKPSSSTSTLPQPLLRERWTSYLSEAPSSSQPISLTNISTPSRTHLYLPSKQIPPLTALARTHNTTVDSLLLAYTSQVFFHRLLATLPSTTPAPSHIVFGIYLANRAPFDEDLSTLAAPTLNIVPLCVRSPLDREIGEIASDIQQDLSTIGRGDMSGVTLPEIWAWTGIRVNLVVNLLKDQPAPTPNSDPPHEETFTTIEAPEETRAPKRGEVNEHVPLPSDHHARDAYLPCIDVELRHRDAKIDVGIFAPQELLSLQGAEGVVRDLVEVMWA